MINVVVAGSFCSLHAGHIALLQKSFEVGDFVFVGLTSDELIKQNKKYKVPYNVRMDRVVNHLNSLGYGGRYLIRPIDDAFGDALTNPDYHKIVVSPETEPMALEINAGRIRNGLSKLEIVIISTFCDERGHKISSTRVLDGTINKEGRYQKHLKVTYLGTSGGMPSKFRNTSSVLVENGKHSILLDCGEGTSAQMAKAGADVNHIVGVLISHAHIDHYIGLPMLVLHTMMLYQRKRSLNILAPKKVIEVLKPMFDSYGIDAGFDIIFNELSDEIVFMAEGLTAKVFAVEHGMDEAYGFTVSDCEDRKIVYSGDTLPCQRVVDEAMGADLLIHEATFASDHEKDTHGHTRVAEAIEIAKKAKVKSLALTHLSVKYHHKLDVYASEILNLSVGSGISIYVADDLYSTKI